MKHNGVAMPLVFFTFFFHKPTIEFLEVDGRRLYRADLWSDLMFVSFGQDLYAVAEDCGADRIKKEASRDKSKKGIAGERRLVLWYLMMYGHEDAMQKRLKKLLRGSRATEK
ncbi:unnamed protein product [Brassica oleracea]